MKYWALLIAGAVSPYLFDATLSWRIGLLVWTTLVFAYAIAFLFPATRMAMQPVVRQTLLYLVIFVSAFLYITIHLQYRLDARLPYHLDKAQACLSGVVRGLPVYRSDNIRFQFQVASEPACSGEPGLENEVYEVLAGQLVDVYWHQRSAPETGPPEIHPGEHWQLPMQVRSNRASINFEGSDAERWSFASGVAARGYVLDGANRQSGAASWLNPDGWRELTLTKIKTVAGNAPAFNLIAALAIADRRGLGARDRQVLADTGTGHLLAISGLHIGLAAVLGYFLGRLILLVCVGQSRFRLAIGLPWVCSWLGAFSYAVLAGFGVSTQRALIMLSVAVIVMLSRQKIHPASAWQIAMASVLFLDPFAPLRAGFWFSFLAVGVLLMLFTPRFGEMPLWKKMLFAQAGITLTMAPLGMYFFQQSSLPGLLANLVAIPVVSFISVPSILLGMITMWFPGPIGGWLFMVSGTSLEWLFIFLERLSKWQPDFMVSTVAPSPVLVVLAMLGALILMMPRGVPCRFVGALLMLPVFLPAANPLQQGVTEVDMLDVGQGLAMLIGNRDYLMVYDTGPGNGLDDGSRWDTVKSTIQPAIARRTIAPDLLVASHADLDHAGGLNSLRNIWPQASVIASLPKRQQGVRPCAAGTSWQAGELELVVLHPSIGLPYLGNDSSCVMSVRSQTFSLLLTGDISKAAEQRLVDQSVMQHQLLSVSHHGSASSSSDAFLAAIQPKLALNSAATNNRFNFPRPEVLQRFKNRGVSVLNTADCGGLRVTSSPGSELTVKAARVQRDAIWRFKASDFCP